MMKNIVYRFLNKNYKPNDFLKYSKGKNPNLIIPLYSILISVFGTEDAIIYAKQWFIDNNIESQIKYAFITKLKRMVLEIDFLNEKIIKAAKIPNHFFNIDVNINDFIDPKNENASL